MSAASWIVGVFAILVVTVFLGDSTDPFDPVKILLVDAFCAIGVAYFAYTSFISRRIQWAPIPALSWLAALALWTGASFIWALNHEAARDAFFRQTAFLVVYLVCALAFRNRRSAEAAVLISLAGAFPVALFAMTDYLRINLFPFDLLLNNRFYSLYPSAFRFYAGSPEWNGFFDGRVSSTFGNPTYLAGWLVLTLPAALSLFLTSRGKRAVYLFFVVSCLTLCLVMTFTRAAWLVFILILPLLLLLLRYASRRAGVKLSAIRLVLFIVLAVVSVACFRAGSRTNPIYGVRERVKSVASPKDTSVLQRELIWKSTWRMARAHPVLGVGAGNYAVFQPEYQRELLKGKWLSHLSFPDRAHNDPMELLSELGVVGLIFYAGSLLAILSVGIWRIREAKDYEGQPLRIGILCGLAAVTLYSFVHFPMHVVGTVTYFWIFAGLLCGVGLGTKKEPDRKEYAIPISRATTAEKPLLVIVLGVLCAFTIAAASAPLRSNILFFIGTRLENARPGLSMQLVREAASLQPDSQEIAFYSCGRLLVEGHKAADSNKKREFYMQSVRECARGLTYHPYMSLMHNNLGNAFQYLERPDLALEEYQKTLELEPNYPLAVYNKGIAYYRMGKYNNAISAFEDAAKLDPGNSGNLYNLGLANARVGRFAEAVSAYRRAIQAGGDSAPVFGSLGLAYLWQGRAEEAISAIRTALKRDPKTPGALGNLGIALYRQGRYSESIETLTAAWKMGADPGVAAYHIAEAFGKLGKRNDAVSWARMAVRKSPESEQFRQLLETLTEK